MIFLNIQEFLIKHVFQMSHRAASISKYSDFQGAIIPAKRTQAQPDSQISCNTNDFFENPN